MESLIPPLEAIFDERAKHPMLLVGRVGESANVMVPAEHATGKLHGAVIGYLYHLSDSESWGPI
jgi:hypothetical protein